jgi:hypothetical protein
VILDGVVCSPGHVSGNLCPAVFKLGMESRQGCVFVRCPGLLGDFWVEMVEPALAALFSVAVLQLGGDGGPAAWSVGGHEMGKLFVLLLTPNPLLLHAKLPATRRERVVLRAPGSALGPARGERECVCVSKQVMACVRDQFYLGRTAVKVCASLLLAMASFPDATECTGCCETGCILRSGRSGVGASGRPAGPSPAGVGRRAGRGAVDASARTAEEVVFSDGGAKGIMEREALVLDGAAQKPRGCEK